MLFYYYFNNYYHEETKYAMAAEAHRVSFSSFVVTVEGPLGPEAVLFLCRLAEKLSNG